MEEGREMSDGKKYTTLLEAAMNAKTTSIPDLVGGFWGLDAWIKKRERPYADQNAQADVEGRPRPIQSTGGVHRFKETWWARPEDPTVWGEASENGIEEPSNSPALRYQKRPYGA